MPRARHKYRGNPEFQHLHLEDDQPREIETKEPCQQHHDSTSEGLSYQVEGEEASPGLDTRGSEDVGSEEGNNLQAGATFQLPSRRRRTADVQEMSLQRLGGRGSGSPSHGPMTSTGPPQRELRVRLTKNLSTRKHSIRRFVDFTISNSVNSQPHFQVVKGEEDVYLLKNHDYLLRVRIKLITKRDQDDPYVKDYITEFKFRGRLFKYNEDKESFEELAVVSQCMAICAVAECRRVPTFNPTLNRLPPS